MRYGDYHKARKVKPMLAGSNRWTHDCDSKSMLDRSFDVRISRCPDCGAVSPAPAVDYRLQGIVRASIHAYNAGKRWEEYEPGYTEHERMAWEIGRAEVEKVKRP